MRHQGDPGPHRAHRGLCRGAVFGVLLAAAACSSQGREHSASPDAARAATTATPGAEPAASSAERVEVSPRTRFLANFPCTECHRTLTLDDPGRVPRGPHRTLTLAHMPNVHDCRLCHEYADLDVLRLLTGERVSFDHSERLCGQCHADKAHDWELGIHGKQVGSWRGLKHRYACVECHDPHNPARPTMTAFPPPPFPKFGIRKESHQ